MGDDAMQKQLHDVSSELSGPARDPILTAIAVFKFGKALPLIILGLGALQLIRTEVREQAPEIFVALGQTVDVVPGQRLRVFGMPVGERWHTPDGLAMVGPRAFGLDVDPVRVGAP